MIKRYIESQIIKDFSKGKIICLIGPRQVGKTTLLDSLTDSSERILRLNCDDILDVNQIENRSAIELKNLIKDYVMVQIDEVQRIENVGLALKKIADLKLPVKVIVTGSSSLGIRDKVYEPATGRLLEYNLYPLSLLELANATSRLDEQKQLESRMIYGLYPEIVTDPADAKRLLMGITNNYLYKDILSYGGIKKPELLQKLLRALALQLGNEVSYNELSKIVGADKQTIENYIDLLEKSFVVFKLSSYSRNLRNEIQKGKKIYFYDNGIRNAIISNFSPLELRNDVGALWENLMISERIKRNSYLRNYAQSFFWRTHSQQEIDYVEEEDGQLSAYEFKWNINSKAKEPRLFKETYPESEFQIITPDNYWPFIS